jgi:hypothetical protein
MDFRDGPSIKKAFDAILMIELVNNDHMLNKNARNDKNGSPLFFNAHQ